jgi:hypothetical protein
MAMVGSVVEDMGMVGGLVIYAEVKMAIEAA